MTTALATSQVWYNEATSMGAQDSDNPGRFLWNWALEIEIGDDVEYGQSRAVWEGGLAFTVNRELPPGSTVRVRRSNADCEDSWVEVRVDVAISQEGGTYVVDGTYCNE